MKRICIFFLGDIAAIFTFFLFMPACSEDLKTVGSNAVYNEIDSDTESQHSDSELVSQCEMNEDYRAILAQKINLKESCYFSEKKFISCVTDEIDCDAAIGYARDPETNECYMFPDLCFPGGWIEDSSCSLTSVLPCSYEQDSDFALDTDSILCVDEPSMDDCRAAFSCNLIIGRKADVTNNCYSKEELYLGCRSGEIDCDAAIGYARDPETNECYMFPDLCLPAGWIATEDCITSSIDFCK